MDYLGQKIRAEESGFDDPPVPDAYIDPYSTFDAYNVRQTRASTHPSDPSQRYQAIAASTAPSRNISYPDNDLPVLRQVAPAPSPASSSGHEIPTSPASMDHISSPTDAANTKFVSNSAQIPRKKRPRGTTGDFVCDTCGGKFTRPHSVRRHNRTCHGKQIVKTSTTTQRKIINAKYGSIVSDPSVHAVPALKNQPAPPTEQSQDAGIDSSLHASILSAPSIHALPAIKTKPASSEGETQVTGLNFSLRTALDTSMIAKPLGTKKSKFIFNPKIRFPPPLTPISTQYYCPRGPDTSADHKTFFCDLCPESFARRDILQVHKARIHGLTEMPYLPVSGIIGRPPYLTGVTHENANSHSLRALKTFEGGGLSISPCQPCITKGLDCIVNPFFSPKCSYCNHHDCGVVCGAAGVKQSKPRGTADYPEVLVAKRNNSSQAVREGGFDVNTADHRV